MDFTDAIEYGLSKVKNDSLKGVQKTVVEGYLSGKDVFVCSPTGSGKSLCFEIAPYVIDWMRFGPILDPINATRTVCIVVAPLTSLMKDQVNSLQKKGVSAICVGPESTAVEIEGVKMGKYNLVFGCPEALLNSYRNVFKGEMRDLLGAVFIDESHCVAKWGKDHEADKAFRADYGRLAELRSLMRKEVPFVTLTATATAATKAIILKDLCMEGCLEVLDNPDRQNTRYSVVDFNVKDLYLSFSWLIEELEMANVSTSKVIIFCRRKQHMKELYELFSQSLGAKSYYRPTGNEPMDDRSRLFAMYHKKTDKLVKETVEKEFCKPNGVVRVLMCSIAFGMGINIKGAYLDLHLGPSGDLADYLQETGRIGRDSSQISHAVLLKYKGCTASKNIAKEMKSYVKNATCCRRKLLLKHFDASVQSETALHACCDICAQICKCLCLCKNDCDCTIKCSQQDSLSAMEKHLNKLKQVNLSSSEQKQNVHHISQSNAVNLRKALYDYRTELSTAASNTKGCNLLTGIDIATGFSRSLIEDIVNNLSYIKDKEYLKENFAFFSEDHVQKTWELVNNVLLASNSDSSEGDTNICEIQSLQMSDYDSDSDFSCSSDSDVSSGTHGVSGSISSDDECSISSDSS